MSKCQIRKGCFETNSSSCHSLVILQKNSNVRMTQEEIRHEFRLDSVWAKERYEKEGKEILLIDPWENDFGRSPFSVLTSFREKLSYAVAEYCGNNYRIKSYLEAEKTFEDVFEPLLIRLIECDEIKWDKTDYIHFEVYADGGDYLDEVEEVPYEKLVYVDNPEKEGLTEDDLVGRCYRNIDKDGREIEDAWFDVPDFGSIDHQSFGRLEGFLQENNLTLEDYLVRRDIVVVIDGDEVHELGNLIKCGLIERDSIVCIYPNRYNINDKRGSTDETIS